MVGFFKEMRHAFALSSKENNELNILPQSLDRFAKAVVRRKLETPVIVFLESLVPLNLMGSQMMYAALPLVHLFKDGKEWRQVASFLEERNAIGRVIQKIEDLSCHSLEEE